MSPLKWAAGRPWSSSLWFFLVSAGCGRTGVLCTVDYVRQLLLTQVWRGHAHEACVLCPRGPSHVPALCPRWSHLTSASSVWSWRFGSSGLWPYRQRCEQGLPIPRTHPSCSCLPFSVTCLPPYPLPQEQYRFLYHTVAQMFLSALQNASRHYQNLKEVPRPPSNPQRPGPRAELHGHHCGSIQPLDSFQ